MLKLTATELPRFVECNGFSLLDKVPAFNQDTKLRDEGDAAHWVCETVAKGEFLAEELVDRKAPNGFYIDADMVKNCEPYINGAQGVSLTEEDTSYVGKTWSVAGRVDRISHLEGVLYVDDFKYGWKIVEPDDNWTLLSHAFGFLSRNPDIAATIHTVVIRIFQPRPYHPKGVIREWHVTIADLWGVYWVKLSAMLDNPTSELNTSARCYKCPARSLCPAAQMSAMNAIEVSEQAFNSHLTPAETSFMLDQMKRAQDVIKQTLKSHEDAALHQAKKGVAIPNYSIQADVSNEQWKDGVTAESLKMITGVDLSKDAVITPGQAKKKGVPVDVLKMFYERKTKGTKLVRISDSEHGKKMFGKK